MAKFPIQIDATNPDLVFNRFRIPGVDDDPNVPHQAFDHDATVVNTIDLESGADIFMQIQSGIPFPPWSFRVTAGGMVDYNPSFDNFLSGRGTTKLTINGFEVTLDARRLGTGGVVIGNIAEKFGFINLKKVRMTPQFGSGYIVLQASGVVGNFEFGLGLSGLFEYALCCKPRESLGTLNSDWASADCSSMTRPSTSIGDLVSSRAGGRRR